nr:flavodoxin family protein [Cryobacterium tagatosivorans]
MEKRNTRASFDYTGLRALFINCTLKRSPEISNTQGLINLSANLMRGQGVYVEMIRAVDHEIATGVYPDMTEHGWATDAWPALFDKVLTSDILVIGGPIWLGDNGSVTRRVIERLYATAGELNDDGQYLYYGKVGGAIITGNEDGVKHCAANVLYSLQHIGYSIPPAADAGWLGEIGPGPSYLDPGSGGRDNEFTNRNITFMTWNLMHLAAILKANGGIPAYGNLPKDWAGGERFGFEPGPEPR